MREATALSLRKQVLTFVCLSGVRTHLGLGCSQNRRDRLAPFRVLVLVPVSVVDQTTAGSRVLHLAVLLALAVQES